MCNNRTVTKCNKVKLLLESGRITVNLVGKFLAIEAV